MKALILSDIHGSADAAKKAISYFEKFNCDKIFILGDILYHGPRNPLPFGHGPMGVVDVLNSYKDYIIAVRGNCDADVDLMMLDFPISDEYTVVKDGKINLFLSHGHIFEPQCFSANALESIESLDVSDSNESNSIYAYLYGHTHVWQLEKNFKNVLLVNPGSTSLPKGGNPSTFGIYENSSQKETPHFGIYNLETGIPLSII